VYLWQGDRAQGRAWLDKCAPVFERLEARLELETAQTCQVVRPEQPV
jgi:hypothetical protein